MLPAVLTSQSDAEKLDELEQIANGYLYRDLLKLNEVRKPAVLEKLIKILAHQVGSETSHTSIANILQISPTTVENYIDILQKAFILYKLKPYSRSLKTEIKNKPKYYFYDTGVLNILLEKYSLNESNRYLGAVFENYVVMEKVKLNQILKNRNKLFYWRNKSGLRLIW
jgi:predicted AAA+ superfamily ATPase